MIVDTQPDTYGTPTHAGNRMSKADFLNWQSDDNYVYEFNGGLLDPVVSMRQDEIALLKQITRRFNQTSYYDQGGELFAEVDVWLSDNQMRRPDVAYYSADQQRQIGKEEQAIPAFVIEFASESDNEQKSLIKRHEYFAAGVQVVWWVFPLYQEVYVYTSPKNVTICTDEDPLSAAPVLPDLEMTVADLFRS